MLLLLQTVMFSFTVGMWIFTLVFFSTKFYKTTEYLLDDNTPLSGARYFIGMLVLIAHFLLVLVSAGILVNVLNNSNLYW